MKRVVITGLGVLAPNGNGVTEFAEALKQQRSGIRFCEKLKTLQFGCQIGGIPQGVEDLRRSLLTEEEAMTMNESLGYAVIAGLECWLDAGMPNPRAYLDVVYEDTGAIVGTGIGGIDTFAQVVPLVDAGKTKRMGSSIPEMVMASGPSAKLGGFLGLGGQVTTNSSACVTGTEAIVEAYFKIREGRLSRILAGGVEGSSPYTWAGFDAMRVLSREYNEKPTQGSRPLSATAKGFVPGSGAGFLMLEELETALNRKARIYAEVLGAEINSGGQRRGGSMTAPAPHGVIRCIKKALERAQIQPKDIDLINGHLTGTFADPHEIRNWQAALELPAEQFPLIQSTKSMIGHGLGAAGGMECVASILQLNQGFIHGSLNSEDLHPDLTSFRAKIPMQTQFRNIQIIAKAGFGFGDVNSCLIFKKYKDSL